MFLNFVNFFFQKGLSRVCSKPFTGVESLNDTLAHIDSVDLNENNVLEFEKNVIHIILNVFLKF